MPKIVEFLGPSGVGKSTLYHAVRKRWSHQSPWVTYHDLDKKIKSFPSDYIRAVSKRFRKIFPDTAEQHSRPPVNDIWGFLHGDERAFLGQINSEFTTTIMDIVNRHCAEGFDGSDRRFVTTYMIMWSIAHIHTAESRVNDKRACLLIEGEGFLSRLMHLSSPSFDEDALDTYINSAPLPKLLFRLQSPVSEIVSRVYSRDRFSSLHRGMDEKTIMAYTEKTARLMDLATEKAALKGVRTVHVDMTQPLEENVDLIVQGLTDTGLEP